MKGGRAEGGMRRGVGIDEKGWRCGGRGKRSHNNDVVLFSHSHTLSLCIIAALPVMGATTVTALLKAGLTCVEGRQAGGSCSTRSQHLR